MNRWTVSWLYHGQPQHWTCDDHDRAWSFFMHMGRFPSIRSLRISQN